MPEAIHAQNARNVSSKQLFIYIIRCHGITQQQTSIARI